MLLLPSYYDVNELAFASSICRSFSIVFCLRLHLVLASLTQLVNYFSHVHGIPFLVMKNKKNSLAFFPLLTILNPLSLSLFLDYWLLSLLYNLLLSPSLSIFSSFSWWFRTRGESGRELMRRTRDGSLSLLIVTGKPSLSHTHHVTKILWEYNSSYTLRITKGSGGREWNEMKCTKKWIVLLCLLSKSLSLSLILTVSLSLCFCIVE